MDETSPVPTEEKTAYPSYAFGFDFGNSEIDCILLNPNATKGKEIVARSTPTAFTQINTTVLKGMNVDTTNSLIVRMHDEQTSYAVGPLALVQSSDPWTGRGDLQRYASHYSLRALLGLSALMVPDREYGLMVVTGLPAETYQKNQGLRKDIKSALSGVWKFTIDSGKSFRTCHVEVGATIMEGAGALIAYGGSDSTQESAIIDIGGRTTDLYVARGQVPILEYCTGKPIGVESATRMLMSAFESKYSIPLSALEARGIMHTYAERDLANVSASAPARTKTKRKATQADASQTNATPTVVREYSEVFVQGNLVPAAEIESYVLEAIRLTTNDIISFVAASWRQSDTSSVVAARFKPVLNIGGGVYYFYNALKARIPHLSKPNDPTHANALGYARAAEKLLEKKRK